MPETDEDIRNKAGRDNAVADNGAAAEPEGDGRADHIAEEEPKPLGQEAPEIVDDASIIGAKRLRRPAFGDAITSFTGGLSVGFGVIAFATAAAAVGGGLGSSSVALLVGSLVFPVGFLILLVGKTELFTENFLLPVAAVIKHRGDLRQLSVLWIVTLGCNLLGALVFAFLASRGDVLAPAAAEELIALAEHKVDYDLLTAFIKAIFAGWLMTTLTWLLVSAEGGLGPRIAVIWAMAALIVLGEFNHVIISAAEVFTAMMVGADISVGEWATANFLPALVGNIVGGLIFETLLQTVQARYQEPDQESV